MIMSKMTPPKKAVNLSRNSSASAASSTSSTSSKYFFSSSKKGLSLHCPKCALKLMSVEMVQIHMANCTGKGKPSAEQGRQSNENGQNDCKIGNDVPCEFCNGNRKFTPHGLILHKSRIHGVKPTATPPPVKEKEKDNSQETSFKCSKCPYKSPYKNNIKLHEEIHEGDILFHCKFCRAPFRSELGRKNCEKNHQMKAKTVVKTEPRIQVARRTPKPTAKIISMSKSAIPTVGRSNGGQSSNNASTPISRNSTVGTKRTRQQMKNRPQDETEEDDEVEVCEPVKKSAGRPRELVRRDASVEVVQPAGASSISSYANMVVNACAQSNLVTFHDVNTLRGTIGKITFQFQCNRCRGELGVARCYRGRAYCVNCCGHADCD